MTAESLDAKPAERKSGKEALFTSGRRLAADVLDFWQWSSSDLLSNALRGVLAEYIVATSVGSHLGVRTEWDAYDMQTPQGLRVEVKSGAYLQSWKQKRLSSIQFGIRPTQGWDASTNEYSAKPVRQAQVYVFCVLAHKDKATVDPLNLDQWDFYCLASSTLDREVGAQKTIGLTRLLQLNPRQADFESLAKAIQEVGHRGS